MPGFDGTGPRRQGPMSGGCRGYCVIKQSPDFQQNLSGYDRYPNRKIGQTPDSEYWLYSLRQQAKAIENALGVLKKRIEIMETSKSLIFKKQIILISCI